MSRTRIRLSDTMRRLNPHLDAGNDANDEQTPPKRARKRHTPEHAKPSVAGVRRGGVATGDYCVSYMRKLEGANDNAHSSRVSAAKEG